MHKIIEDVADEEVERSSLLDVLLKP